MQDFPVVSRCLMDSEGVPEGFLKCLSECRGRGWEPCPRLEALEQHFPECRPCRWPSSGRKVYRPETSNGATMQTHHSPSKTS